MHALLQDKDNLKSLLQQELQQQQHLLLYVHLRGALQQAAASKCIFISL